MVFIGTDVNVRFVYIERERGREREGGRERERWDDVVCVRACVRVYTFATRQREPEAR